MANSLLCKAYRSFLCGFLVAIFCLPSFSEESLSREQYLAYARAAADWTYEHKDELLERWKANFDPLNVFGYRPPGGYLEMAVIFSYLYEKEKTPEYALRAKDILMTYGDFRSAYPESSIALRPDYDGGVPALPDFFTVMRYIRAYHTLHSLDVFSAEDVVKAETLIADSMRYLLRTQEWGPMNRAALRAESLAWAVRALPRHPDRAKWEMQRKALGDDNWGNWQIEDATIYNGVWLYALLGYADALGKLSDLFQTPEMYYYCHYYLNLMSPSDMIPDLGDAHWNANWAHFLVFFEAAAARIRHPGLKWAAQRIAMKFIDFDKPTSVGLGHMLLDCYRWSTDDVKPAAPSQLSREVMEDVQGKKIVFRNGWFPESTYILLNYRDEGDGGLNFRDYLRDTIPVEEEKMTHGHADENSIVLLMSKGSVLLHDGGYRDFMPSGPFGAYRQDYFHNRLCVRPEKMFLGQEKGGYRYSVREEVPGQSLLEFMRNAGSYRRVRTQKIDFLTFDDFDYSRTRLIDDNWNYQSDRIIVYVKDPECFVVFDIFKALKEDYFTLSSIWHTRQILLRGPHWYETSYDRIQKSEFPQQRRLLLSFPQIRNVFEGVEPEKRHYQDEWLIHQTMSQHFELGETAALITVLTPLDQQDDPQKGSERISLLPSGAGRRCAGVMIRGENKTSFVGVKNDPRKDMSRDWRRPRYTFESGRVQIGDFETDGDFLFATLEEEKLGYTIVNLTKALFRGKTLFAAEDSVFGLAFDASPDQAGVGKLRYWRDKTVIKAGIMAGNPLR